MPRATPGDPGGWRGISGRGQAPPVSELRTSPAVLYCDKLRMRESEPAIPDEKAQANLLRRIAAQDPQALGELYDEVAKPLFATSVRILGDPHECEEVLQDVFVEIWHKAAVFDETLGTAFHWIMSIVRNRSIDRLRARQRRGKMLDCLLQEFAPPSLPNAAGAQPCGLGAEDLAGIRAAVHRLPGDQRRALEMAFFHGQTHAEIAAETGEPLGTVKARIRRAMLKLRSALQEYT